jgi:hypothetical protein
MPEMFLSDRERSERSGVWLLEASLRAITERSEIASDDSLTVNCEL